MNRTELAEAVASKTGLDRKQAEAAVGAVTASIVEEVKAGNKVSIFGFGSFEPKSRAARTARNPQTQAVVKVAASKSVGFRPASAFKETLNSRGRAGAAKKASASRAGAATAKASKATGRASASKSTASKSTASKSTASRSTAKKTTATKSSPSRTAKATKATKKR